MCFTLKPRVLYVDDDADAREVISLMLTLSDDSYDLTAFSSAENAVLFMENQPVALFILGYRLPEMTGVELCRRIRQFDADASVLFLSASARPHEVAEARAAGASDYLVKPINLERLVETVKQFLSENAA